MKLHYLLCLCSLASSVIASLGAGPYQIVFYWYAYRLQVVNNYPVSIGSGCPGQCYFDDFIEWIHGNDAPYKPTGIGSNLSPAVDDAVNALTTAGYKPVTNAAHLLPGAKLPAQPTFSALFDPLVEEVQKTRAAMKAAGVDETKSDELNKMKTAISQATAWRRVEQATNTLKAFNAKGYKITTVTKTQTAPDGTTYEELDTDAMLAQNPSAKAKVKASISNFVTTYNADKKGGLSHFNAIQSCTSVESALADPPVCGS